jgi:hypothetical protein
VVVFKLKNSYDADNKDVICFAEYENSGYEKDS